MRRRDRPLDIFRQMRVLRSAAELAQGGAEEAGTAPKRATPSPDTPAVAPKKKLNIPVGDVLVDPDYDTFLPATYSMPSGYVRYAIKMPDEVDLIADYLCDCDDEEWIDSKLASDDKGGYDQHLTINTLEKMINTLERLTGFGDTVTLMAADKSLRQAFPDIPHVVYTRLVSDVYQYWVSKRKKSQKPCSRRYWPPTSVTDTNPHMVFRPREKERYRLRKHRKNDLDSYRKLQQLRREFAGAKSLLQLVIEREKLKRADLVVQAEIIDQTIYETQNPGASVPRVEPPNLFSYKLQYPHLLKTEPPVAPIGRKRDSLESKLLNKSNRGDGEVVERQKPGRKPGAELKRKRASLEAAAGQDSGVAVPEATANVVLTDETAPALFANALLTGQALYEANTARLNTLGVPGPPAFLQPQWPSFMSELPTREKMSIPTSIKEYADDLELRQDHPLPSKFRCRGRVGRGGRIIMDRVPVYDDVSNETTGTTSHNNDTIRNGTYIYPTSLPSIHEQARFSQAVRDCKDAKRTVVTSDDIYSAVLMDPSQVSVQSSFAPGKQSSIAGSAGLRHSVPPISNKNMELYLEKCQPIRDLGLALPLARFVQPAELSRREHEIYGMPDSDDELIDLPDGYIAGPSPTSMGQVDKDGNVKPIHYVMRI